jgi:hypothetical protein
MHALMDRIREKPVFAGDRLLFVRGYAVVLPHCNWADRICLRKDGSPTNRNLCQEKALSPRMGVRGVGGFTGLAGSRSSPACRRSICSAPSSRR